MIPFWGHFCFVYSTSCTNQTPNLSIWTERLLCYDLLEMNHWQAKLICPFGNARSCILLGLIDMFISKKLQAFLCFINNNYNNIECIWMRQNSDDILPDESHQEAKGTQGGDVHVLVSENPGWQQTIGCSGSVLAKIALMFFWETGANQIAI